MTIENLKKEQVAMTAVREQKLKELYTAEGALQVINFLINEEAKGVAPAEPVADA